MMRPAPLALRCGSAAREADNRSAQVQRVHLVERRKITAVEKFPAETTRDVDETVDAAEPLPDLLHGAFSRGAVREIDVTHQQRAGRVGRIRVNAVQHGDLPAVLREALRHGFAEHAEATRDDHRSNVCSHGLCLPMFRVR